MSGGCPDRAARKRMRSFRTCSRPAWPRRRSVRSIRSKRRSTLRAMKQPRLIELPLSDPSSPSRRPSPPAGRAKPPRRPSMAEPADINVDELRRRARRRLIGAIVLALGAAVIVPMLLESEPKPLGEDVSVKIPPVDDGKFVNRLSGATDGADNAKGARKEVKEAPAAEAPPRKSVADAEKA